MELASGVYALTESIEQGDRSVSIQPVAVETDRGVLLVDVGFESQFEALRDELEAAGLSLSDVWGVVLTHQDGDHVGALEQVVDATDAVVFAHRDETPFIDGRQDPIKSEGDRYPPVPVDVELDDAERFTTHAGPMEVVYTPGHSPGHLSLYFPEEKLLVAADALTAPAGELAGPNEQYTLDMEEAAESVGKLSEHDIERTHCYHGGLVEQGTGAIAKIWNDLAG